MAALFASLAGILRVLACMRYQLSIVLPDNDREAASLCSASRGVQLKLLGVLATIARGSELAPDKERSAVNWCCSRASSLLRLSE